MLETTLVCFNLYEYRVLCLNKVTKLISSSNKSDDNNLTPEIGNLGKKKRIIDRPKRGKNI